MSEDAPKVVQDAILVLRTVKSELDDGRKPYASDIRRIIERGLGLGFAQYIQFLERYGFVTLDRRSDLLKLTRAGQAVVDADPDRIGALEGDARYYFGEQFEQAEAQKAAEALEEQQGVKFDARYLRYESLGKGGLGTVWRGRLLSIDRPVAIKTIDHLFSYFTPQQKDEIVRRLLLAVRKHATIISPFVVQILDQNTLHDPPYYTMEYAPGGNLRTLLDRGALPAPVAMRYFIQVALGLKAAHEVGMIHRDLKPENILLDDSGNAKISDFSMTRIVERDGRSMVQAYVGFGSVGYMAPEQFHPGRTPGPRADIYALGILLYEMLVGRLPGRRSPMPSDVVEGLSTDIDDIFDFMTQDDPAKRPRNIDQVLTQIWTSKTLVELLDARQAPFFVEPPVELPGFPERGQVALPPEAGAREVPSVPTAAPRTVSSSPKIEETPAEGDDPEPERAGASEPLPSEPLTASPTPVIAPRKPKASLASAGRPSPSKPASTLGRISLTSREIPEVKEVHRAPPEGEPNTPDTPLPSKATSAKSEDASKTSSLENKAGEASIASTPTTPPIPEEEAIDLSEEAMPLDESEQTQDGPDDEASLVDPAPAGEAPMAATMAVSIIDESVDDAPRPSPVPKPAQAIPVATPVPASPEAGVDVSEELFADDDLEDEIKRPDQTGEFENELPPDGDMTGAMEMGAQAFLEEGDDDSVADPRLSTAVVDTRKAEGPSQAQRNLSETLKHIRKG
ncbi:MAG: protein kinase domain-containing protein [Bradymonadia bacterium]